LRNLEVEGLVFCVLCFLWDEMGWDGMGWDGTWNLDEMVVSLWVHDLEMMERTEKWFEDSCYYFDFLRQCILTLTKGKLFCCTRDQIYILDRQEFYIAWGITYPHYFGPTTSLRF